MFPIIAPRMSPPKIKPQKGGDKKKG